MRAMIFFRDELKRRRQNTIAGCGNNGKTLKPHQRKFSFKTEMNLRIVWIGLNCSIDNK